MGLIPGMSPATSIPTATLVPSPPPRLASTETTATGTRTAAATADLTSAAVARPDLVVVVTATFAVAAASADAGLRVGRGIRVRKVAAPSFPSRRLMATACAPCGRRSWAAARDVRGVRSTRARRCAPSDVNPDEGNVGGSETPDEDFQTHETTRSGCRS